MKQLFRYAYGRRETDADQPLIREATAAFRDSQFRLKVLIMFLAQISGAVRQRRVAELLSKSRIPTKLSYEASARRERSSASACRRSRRCSTPHGTAYAADASRAGLPIAHPVALRALVQRQRHPGEILDSERDRAAITN